MRLVLLLIAREKNSLPNGSLKVSHTKDLKNSNQYTQLSANLESLYRKTRMVLLWADVVYTTPVSKWEWGIKRTRTSYAGPLLITVHLEN